MSIGGRGPVPGVSIHLSIILFTLRGEIMKKTLLTTLCACLAICLFIGPVYGADIKIGIINTSKILSDSKAAKNAKIAFNKELETRQATYVAKGKSVQTMKEELSSKGNDMTPAVYTEKNAAYTKANKELTRLKTEMEEELKAKDTELSNKLLSEISGIVSDYCKKEKFTVILEKNYVAAYDGTIDITDKILQLYDATITTTTTTK
jgi:outer membrane protein